MKRILFTAMMLIGMCLSASAQEVQMHYFSDSKGENWAIRDFIDRSAKIYRFDGDSEDECTMEMRNYKKNAKAGYEKGKKKGHITIVTDPNLDIKAKELDLSKQTISITLDSHTMKYYFLTGEQQDKRKGKSAGEGESLNPVDKAKDKAKGLLNKGKNLFNNKK